MAVVADFNTKFRHGGSHRKGVSAGTSDFGIGIPSWVDLSFHNLGIISRNKRLDNRLLKTAHRTLNDTCQAVAALRLGFASLTGEFLLYVLCVALA